MLRSIKKIRGYLTLLLLINFLILYSQLINTISIKSQPIKNNFFYVLREEGIPKLDFSTFLGGSFEEYSYGIAVTTDGISYITGYTRSVNFPSLNAYFDTNSGGADVFITKFSNEGSLIWSTYLGGSLWDWGNDIVVDSNNNCYLTGGTRSVDFPILNAYSDIFRGNSETIVTKFLANGSLQWSTFIGGNNSEIGFGIAIDATKNIHVAGGTTSKDFPILNAYNSTYGGETDAFVTKFDENGSLLQSTFFGGKGYDMAFDITCDAIGNSYIIGDTESINFPMLNAYNWTYGGNGDIFITKFSLNGTILWSTYLGGSDTENGREIAIDANGNCIVIGSTQSNNFPTLNAYNNSLSGESDIFVSKFSSDGKLLWSTFIGGSNYDEGFGIAVDREGNNFIIGYTQSIDFPTLLSYDDSFNPEGIDVFVSKLSPDGELLWSTFFGGNGNDGGFEIDTDLKNNYYIIGATESTNFPIKNAFDNSFNNGLFDTFLFKFSRTEQVKKIAFIVFGTYSFVFFSVIILIIIVKKRK